VNWKDLVDVLDRQVSVGSITTYSEVSRWAYGKPHWDRPVRSMINCARNKGFQAVTNRVVGFDGKLAILPDGSDQQRQQLLSEGVPFTADGRVDLTVNSPVVLGQNSGEESAASSQIVHGAYRNYRHHSINVAVQRPCYGSNVFGGVSRSLQDAE
jgi:alkylated DNA nucleotide flippase Atl1